MTSPSLHLPWTGLREKGSRSSVVESFLMICLALALVCLPAELRAQDIGGTLRGVVTDATGAVIGTGTAVLSSTDTGVSYKATINTQGQYAFTSVQPGRYTLKVMANGFGEKKLDNVIVNLNQTENLPVSLAVGSASEVVEVTGDSEKIVTEETSVVGLFTANEIKNLPLNGRDYQNLIYLSPGVTRSASGTGQGSGVVAGGSRPTDNNYLIDGVDNNDPVVPSGAAGAAGGNIGAVPLDEIAEFSVISSNGSAEFGRSSGAIVNVVTKGGTNAIHGTLFEFIRNPKFSDRQWFDIVGFKSALKQNDFGGRFGIPLFKDKTFFAGAYEGYRQRQNATTTEFFASQELVNTVTDPAFKALLQAYYPVVSNGGTAITAANYSQTGVGVLSAPRTYRNPLDGDTGFVRFDQNWSSKHQSFLTGSILDGVFSATNTGTVAYSGAGETLRPYHFVFGDNYAFSSHFFNSFREGVQRTSYAFVGEVLPAVALAAGTARTAGPYAGTPYSGNVGSDNGVPTVASAFGLFSTLGTPSNYPQGRSSNVITETDTLSYLRGRHQFKVGGELRRIQENGYFSNAIRPSVSILDSSLANFDAGAINVQTQYFYLTGSSNRGFRQYEQGYYAEDSWRTTDKLTLEFGLRYEIFPPFSEAKNLVGNGYVLGASGPQNCTSLPVGSPNFANVALLNPVNFGFKPFCPDYNNFAPRVGFSYDVTGKGTTVLRGGWGEYYDRIFDNIYGNTRFNPPFVATTQVATGVYNGAVAASTLNLTTTYTGTVIDTNLRTPYTQHFNFALSQELSKNTSLTVGYVGSIAKKLFTTLNPNFGSSFPDLFRPTNAANALANGGVLTRSQADVNAGIIRGPLGNLSYRTSNGVSNFNALEITVKHRQSHGLSAQVAYTWAHSLDTISDEIAGNTDSSSPQSTIDNLLAPYLSPGSPCPVDNTGVAPGTVTAATLTGSTVTSATAYLHAVQCASGNNSLTLATAPNYFIQNYVKFRPIGSNYGDSSFDVRHRVAMNAVYALPFGQGRALGGNTNTLVNEFIGGWNLSTTVDTQSGTPFIVLSGVDSNRDGSTNDRAIIVSAPKRNPSLVKNSPIYGYPTSGANVSRYQCAVTAVDVTRSKTCTAGQSTITFNQGLGVIDPVFRQKRGSLREPGLFEWDAEVFKNFKVYHEANLRFSADGFNVLNHANFGVLGNTLTSSSFARSSSQRSINNTFGRQFQFALKLEF